LRREIVAATAAATRTCERNTGEGAVLRLTEIRRQIPVAAYVDDALNASMCELLYPERPGCRFRNGSVGLPEVVTS
jgi:hypothetical protein